MKFPILLGLLFGLVILCVVPDQARGGDARAAVALSLAMQEHLATDAVADDPGEASSYEVARAGQSCKCVNCKCCSACPGSKKQKTPTPTSLAKKKKQAPTVYFGSCGPSGCSGGSCGSGGGFRFRR